MKLFEVGNQTLSPQQIQQLQQRVAQLSPMQYSHLVRRLQILKQGNKQTTGSGAKPPQVSASNLGWYVPGQQNKT